MNKTQNKCVEELKADAKLFLEIGSRFLQLKKVGKAAKTFNSAGYAFFRAQMLEEAKDAYKQAGDLFKTKAIDAYKKAGMTEAEALTEFNKV